ncbi:Septation initiation network scaffold protein cdc11 [Apiospora saccharicola]|uniref:Septation initiation network scaffold protein cdc11 n=1 Tax=Apiospora saccharicola TaxID=335842 RepID=A0ABR1W2P0_9PEZI
MSHAWLDSLSEDWVSEPRSVNSQAQLSPFPSQPNSRRGSTRDPTNRLPHLSLLSRKSQPTTYDSSLNVLAERSQNDVNIRSSQRDLADIAQSSKSSQRGRQLSRSASESNGGSVVHNINNNTVHKAQSASPTKDTDSIPEWRRRLLHGEMSYGETKDLFSSAANGLENIFRPPSDDQPDEDKAEDQGEGYTMNDTTLPSSPPPYIRRRRQQQQQEEQQRSAEDSLQDLQEDSAEPLEIQPELQKKSITFAMNIDNFNKSAGRADKSKMKENVQSQNTNPGDISTTPPSPASHLDASRKVSAKSAGGKSDGRNESFSPILLSPRKTEDGRVQFAPMELSSNQLKKRLQKLRQNQMILDSDPSSQMDQHSVRGSNAARSADSTAEYAKKGGYLNTRRGGRSTEGSFKNRPLSPPVHTDTSEMLPESSLQASTPKQFPTVRTDRFSSAEEKQQSFSSKSTEMPPPPKPSPEKQAPRQPTSGSPLKLFGPYDTFTNQTLLRRISQFEDPMTESPSRSMEESVLASPGAAPSKSRFNRGFAPTSSPRRPQTAERKPWLEKYERLNRFGSGALDGYSFSEELSLASQEYSTLTDKENVAPESSPLPPSRPIKFDLSQHSTVSEADSLMVDRQRNKSSTTTESSKYGKLALRTDMPMQAQGANNMMTPKRDGSESKRPRTSPSKDPTPKRRRTLHRSDVAYGLNERSGAVVPVQVSHNTMQRAIADRQHGSWSDGLRPINPALLMAQQAERPRTPTPSQRSSVQRDREPLADIPYEAATGSIDESDISIQNSDFTASGSRKTSMKTQDFLNEAEKIMAMIRSRARPHTGLASVEESESESAQQRDSMLSGTDESSFEDSTKEPFSRPPSREGRAEVSRIAIRQDDPELMDKLRQYEERSDMGDLATYSLRSIGLAKEALEQDKRIKEEIQRSLRSNESRQSSLGHEGIISDMPPNVRFSRNPDVPSNGASSDYPSQDSRSSFNSSGRSGRTASSRGSDSRRLIAPDVVSQLIGDQVGNMVLDKEKNVWTKVKTRRPQERVLNFLPSEDSEDDPFASIPDLSVDETREKLNLKLKTAPLEDLNEFVREDFVPPPSCGKTSTKTRGSLEVENIINHKTETFSKLKTVVTEEVVDTEDVEHEITLLEDRIANSPARRKNLTITFSSPIASIIQDHLPQHGTDGSSTEDSFSTVDRSIGNVAADSMRRGRHPQPGPTVTTRSTSSGSRSRSRNARNISVKAQSFFPRPISRIDEQDEETLLTEHDASEQKQLSILGESSLMVPEEDDDKNRSVSIIITPGPPARRYPGQSATPVIAQHVGNLSLSALSEFTLNHGDQSLGLEVSYVVGEDYLVTGNKSKKVLSQAIRTLVEKITEVEPFEPDWDGMRELDVSSKQLQSLHKLDDFCGQVVSLDASDNSISYLDGVPQSVRNLKMANNCLSGLTAWGHLMNLQYIDISNNEIDSLYAFKDLVHLRNLRADNNHITSLDGIKFHDSLQVLRVRGNLIEDLNMDGARMDRLTELDLQGNQIRSVRNLDQLPSLSTLNLDNNRLESFAATQGQAMTGLKYLKISDNLMKSLDMAGFPGIRMIHADRNRLTKLSGFTLARRLDSLSLREQKGETALDMAFLTQIYELRKLFLSGNLLTTFDPRVDFLNLQLLELANCGLESLSPNLGQLMPNLRTLNVNFNALGDLSALRYIPRLKKLLVAGNRLADVSGATAGLLTEFPHLSKLDLRDNAATLGFYPLHHGHSSLMSTENNNAEQQQQPDPFTLPEASRERDATYAARLDMGTKKRRRLHELAITQACPRLKMLDGLALQRDEVTRRDDVWTALAACGAIAEPKKAS